MSTFLCLMINSFIMLTQRKFIWFYTHTYTITGTGTYAEHSWFIWVSICVRKPNLSACLCTSCRGNVPRSMMLEAGIWNVDFKKMQPCTSASSSSSSTVRFSQLLLGCCAPADQFTTFFVATTDFKVYPIMKRRYLVESQLHVSQWKSIENWNHLYWERNDIQVIYISQTNSILEAIFEMTMRKYHSDETSDLRLWLMIKWCANYFEYSMKCCEKIWMT